MASTPTPPANSATLFRASSDASTINTITDLRLTSCAAGPFSAISDASGQATLDDLLKNGAYVRRFSQAGRTPNGFAEGAFVSFDTSTTFKVTTGALYINGKYRSVSQDITIAKTNDDPANGISGLDTGSVAANTTYFVYGAADQDSVKPFSVTYSTSGSAPTGVTNARLIGSIKTDNGASFVSKDTVTAHAFGAYEMVGGWVNFDGSLAALVSADAYNVSSLTDGGTGTYTVTWDRDFNKSGYAAPCASDSASAHYCSLGTRAVGSVAVKIRETTTNADTDGDVSLVAFGDTRN